MSTANVQPLVATYQPRRFSDVRAQDEAVSLITPLVTHERPPPILLYGPPGTGKTTLARIYAQARHCAAPDPSPCGRCADCKRGLTPYEWYAFSGARWDKPAVAKEVEELMRIVPSDKYGFFIDEVHGLEDKSADVLLTELDKARKGRFFICATSELESVRPALRSRCRLVPLKLVPKAELFNLAQTICASEAIPYETGALDIMVSLARGSARELVMALDSVATRGHLTPALLKAALSLGWTDHLMAYLEALIGADLQRQFEALAEWPAPAEAKARAIKECLLFLFNFEASTPRLHDHVNAAFHLIGAHDRRRLAGALNSRARAEGFPVPVYWQQLMNFWLFEPALIADDASLAIKLHEFHRLITPTNGVVIVPPKVPEQRTRAREFRSRSKKVPGQNSPAADGSYLTHRAVERLTEAISFLGQRHGRLVNLAMDIEVRAPADRLEEAASSAISSAIHELGLCIARLAGRDGDRHYHWVYRNHRSEGLIRCHLAIHVPYEQMESARRWLDDREWKVEGAQIEVTAEWWNPLPRNTKARDKSRLNFQWKRMRELWSTLDPEVLHWDEDGTRKPLRQLLGLTGVAEASGPMSKKIIGVSHSLDRGAQKVAEKNKMKLLSAFKDAAWSHLDSGWELSEYRDRMRETAERKDQVRRVEYIGKEASPLAEKRYTEELQALQEQWPDDPRQRPRTWTPWWSAQTVTT